MRILFSPIGVTDPIRYEYDGPCLHIIRHYKPDVVKLFFTKEMEAKEELDHRYTLAIKNVAPEITIISHVTDIVDAYRFDRFMDVLPSSVRDFADKYPEAELLLNLSSGTPQIKTTMAILAVELPHCKGIQVASPARGSNITNNATKEIPNIDDYLAFNLDNEPDAENRCEEPPLALFKNFRERNQIMSLIKARRYGAALTLTNDAATTISDETRRLLKYGFKRSKLELKTAKSLLTTKEERAKFHAIKDDAAERLFEFFLVMQNHILNKDYSELLTKLTPFMYELLREHVQRNINCNDFFTVCCEPQSKNGMQTYCLNRDKIKGWNPEVLAYLDEKFNRFTNTDASFINLYHIISALGDITEANTRLLSLLSSDNNVNVRQLNNLRNTVAHNIIMNMTEEDFQEKTGLAPNKLIDVLFNALKIVFESNSKIKITKEARDSYDVLNDYIEDSMELS